MAHCARRSPPGKRREVVSRSAARRLCAAQLSPKQGGSTTYAAIIISVPSAGRIKYEFPRDKQFVGPVDDTASRVQGQSVPEGATVAFRQKVANELEWSYAVKGTVMQMGARGGLPNFAPGAASRCKRGARASRPFTVQSSPWRSHHSLRRLGVPLPGARIAGRPARHTIRACPGPAC